MSRPRNPWRLARALARRAAPLLSLEPDDLQLRIGQAAVLAQRASRASYQFLWDAEVRVFSQWGEDGILDYLCDAASLARPGCLEIGAGDFRECNTRFLAEHRNATVVAVDAREDLSASIMGMQLAWRTTIIPMQTWVTPSTVGAVFETARSLGRLDLVSLDIDGNDYWVAEAMPLDDVSIIVAEFNPTFGAKRAVSVPRDDDFGRAGARPSWLYFGASLRAFVDLFAAQDFVFVGTNRACMNAFFIRADAVPALTVVPPSGDLESFTDFHYRESRGADGRLSYATPREAVASISSLPLVDVHTGHELTVDEARG